MSRGRDGKKRSPGFGRRGREPVEPTERKLTALQRLTRTGNQLWDRMQPKAKKQSRPFGYKRSPK